MSPLNKSEIDNEGDATNSDFSPAKRKKSQQTKDNSRSGRDKDNAR